MRDKIVAGNWKMNNDFKETNEILQQLKSYAEPPNVEIMVAPSFTQLHQSVQLLKSTNISVVSQNISVAQSGAYTGEVSPKMLKGIGVNIAIIGHSERRQYFNENDHILLKKLKKAISEKFKVFFCIGENINERENNNHFDIIEKQLNNTVFKIESVDVNNLIIAYEPIWAIGTGLTASPEQAQEMHFFIREIFKSKYGSEISDNLSIIYGGSVKPSSAKDIFGKKDVDGGLIGGASLRAEDFIDIVNSI